MFSSVMHSPNLTNADKSVQRRVVDPAACGALVPAGRRAPGNQSGRGKDGGAQSLLGKAVQGRLESCVEDKHCRCVTSTKSCHVISGVCTRCSAWSQNIRRVAQETQKKRRELRTHTTDVWTRLLLHLRLSPLQTRN